MRDTRSPEARKAVRAAQVSWLLYGIIPLTIAVDLMVHGVDASALENQLSQGTM